MKTMLRSILTIVILWIGMSLAGTEGTRATILDESFEGSFPPTGWTQFSDITLESWAQSSEKSHSGTQSAIADVSYLYNRNIYLVTPAIDLASAPGATLYFFEDHNGWDESSGTVTVEVSTTSASSASAFTPVLIMTPANHTNNGFSGAAVSVDLSAYIGESTVYVAFHYNCPSSPVFQWFIDDVKVTTPSDHDVMAVSLNMDSHYVPSTLITPSATVKNVGLNTETFDVQFGYTAWDGSAIVIDTKTVSNLAVNTSTDVTFANYTFQKVGYEFFVKTVLSGDMDSSNDTAPKFIDSYDIQKEIVLAEKCTDTECTYCPGAAEAMDELHKNYPDYVGVVEYHGGFSGNDPFDNGPAATRRGYYGVTGFPTAYFGGDRSQVGGASAGSDWTSIYNGYEAKYLAERQEFTPFTMSIRYTENGNNITMQSTTTYQSITNLKNLKLRYALTESHIAYNWETSMDSLQFVERNMFPAGNGKDFNTSTSAPVVGTQIVDDVTFTLDPSWVKENCEFVAFVQNDDNKEVLVAAKVNLANGPSAMDKEGFALKDYKLQQNYPNPFNPTTEIRYQLANREQVNITLYDASGAKIATLLRAPQNAGGHSLQVDGSDLASGIYFYRIQAGSFSAVRKMVLMK